MVIIQVPENKREKVLLILLQNGNFRSLDKNVFNIEENAEGTIKKLKDEGIEVTILEK